MIAMTAMKPAPTSSDGRRVPPDLVGSCWAPTARPHQHGRRGAHAERHHIGERREVDGDLVARHLDRAHGASQERDAPEARDLELELERDGHTDAQHAHQRGAIVRFVGPGTQQRTKLVARDRERA